MSKVAIIMGSESDRPTVESSLEYFKYFRIQADVLVLSAHRNPDEVAKFAREAESSGYAIIIACAGMAAHLGGVIAAHTTLPVVGVPLDGSALSGVDALYSMVMMPAGVPVATMAIGKAGAKNAAVLCAQILALGNEHISERLREFKKNGCKVSQ
jgi:5-(carboxyamino)imidazole ribonucleotide mutase